MPHDVEPPVAPDRRVLQCNYAVGTSPVPDGARAYVVLTNPGNGHDRMVVLARSRSGRWIETWVDGGKLRDFRVKTLPPGHPLYGNDRIMDVTEHNEPRLHRLLSPASEVGSPCPPDPA